ncbi:MAG: hypothetical protein ACF8R9_06745 [Phycisphaerales bacterium JB054]
MRIPTRRLHRAFPELDRFTDEQCKIFIRAASKHGWRPRIHAAILLLSVPLTGLLALTASSFARLWIDDNVPGGVDRPAWDWVEYAGYLLACFGAALVAFLLRDLLFISRVRRVIRGRGSCIGCRYSLLGITIAEGFTVTCPECGLSIEADPALHEITTDDSGRRQFMPSGAHEGMVFWTPRRRKRLKRALIAAAVFVFVVLPLCWGGYELFLRVQASIARAQRHDPADFLALIERHQISIASPLSADASPDADANVWVIIEAVERGRAGVDEEVTARYEHLDDSGRSQDPHFGALLPGARDDNIDWTPSLKQQQDLALALINGYREAGVLDLLDSVADAPLAVRPAPAARGEPLALSSFISNAAVRNLARICAARMHLARQAGDLESFTRAAETGLALARATEMQGSLNHSLVSVAVEGLMHQRLRAVLCDHPDAEWVDAIDRAVERQRPNVPAGYPFQTEKLYGLDLIAWLFSDPDRARFGRFSDQLKHLSHTKLEGALGTYWQNRDAFEEAMDSAAALAGLDAYQRDPGRLPLATRGLLLMEVMLSGSEQILGTLDTRHATRRGTTIMLALERHRIARGTYPDSLDELVPEFLDALPLDPWSGETFCYTDLTGPGTHPHYQLYALGKNMTDDGGAASLEGGLRQADMIFSPERH